MSGNKVVIYARTSTDQQFVEGQVHELEEVGERLGWNVIEVIKDINISGRKDRVARPGFKRLNEMMVRKEMDLLAIWSVDRLGRNLSDLVSFLNDLNSRGIDVYIHQQNIDTTTQSGKMVFQLMGVFAECEAAMTRESVKVGLARARRKGKKIGRPRIPKDKEIKIRETLRDGHGIHKTAKIHKVGSGTVQRIKRELEQKSP